MPGACVLHASVPVFPSHVQPIYGGHVTKHRSSPPSYNPYLGLRVEGLPCRQRGQAGPGRASHLCRLCRAILEQRSHSMPDPGIGLSHFQFPYRSEAGLGFRVKGLPSLQRGRAGTGRASQSWAFPTRRLIHPHVSDTPARVLDTPERVLDTPMQVSDTPRDASVTPG